MNNVSEEVDLAHQTEGYKKDIRKLKVIWFRP